MPIVVQGLSDFETAGIARYSEDFKRAKTPLWAERCRLWMGNRKWQRMDSNSAIIGVVSLGEIPALVPKVIAAHISGYYNLPARVLGPREHPAYAFDKQRLQYNAGTILKNIETLPFKDYFKIVGILSVDIFMPIFKHVYGEARQGSRDAIVSLYRLSHNLNGSSVAQTSLYDRAAKVALHELGHLFNLQHCDDPKCLMHFSGALADLDGLSFNLCRYCRTYFKDTLNEA